jgi:inward rectifier potassium channel
VSASPSEYQIRVIGAHKAPVRDLYFRLLRLSWPKTLIVIVSGYLVLNALFACGFFFVGGVDHMREGSFLDAFFFSVQTMGTIGYGAMSPTSNTANAVVVGESVVSLLFTAAATGLVFAKFSRPSARIVFTENAVIGPMNGVPVLSFRLGNQRTNLIVEASVRIVMVRTEQTHEGRTLYRTLDLPLTRERMLSLSRSWTVMHLIDEKSPLHGETDQSLREKDVELMVSVSGTDDIWMQTVHARHRYMASEIRWASRHADILTEDGNDMVLDLRKFHDVEPA